MTRRTDRVGDLIQREIGTVILQEIRDPRIGFVTISRVQVSQDLAFADVFVSVLGTEQEQQDSLAGLQSSASYLRKHLSLNMKTRTVPRLKFILDKGCEHSERINELLKNIDLE
ncbi:MAG: 30S ribosome-binding factor RbfA [Fibrobacteria bacterium]|nr:30S ribosome-binding factor RbfA [Fibrobacteria bacterium]